jgi:hypothetical protein
MIEFLFYLKSSKIPPMRSIYGMRCDYVIKADSKKQAACGLAAEKKYAIA